MELGNAIEQTKCELVLLYGKLRRFCLTTLAPRRTRSRMLRRQGKCRQCASCCKFIFRCPLLDENNLCKIYHSRFRPLVCRRFPIDQRDVEDVYLNYGRKCGYSFVETKNRRRRFH
ncbi:MAG: YkgJ family cysteine cluster protein [Desulfobacteraceae bacterium]|nr:YkgJ family cysteine cluster protein [Desulfobacteraceae bacterium]MCF8094833.1 YkgJ family cysteine cluster protein [Desulfobacteraceae bacterium]